MTDAALAPLSGFGTLGADQLGRLVDQLPVLLWSTDAELRVTSRRGGGLALLDEWPRTSQGLRVGAVVEHPAEAARAVAAHQAALRGEATAYEITFRGRTFSARVEPLRDAGGAICGIVGMAFDVTQRKHTEQALRESEERLQLVTRATNDAVWDWDLVTNALWWGRGFETLFGYAREEIEPGIESWRDRIHPEDRARVFADIHAAIDAGKVFWSGEYRFRRRDGSYADILDRGYVIHAPTDGRPSRMVGSMMDVSERKRSEALLQASRTALRLLATRHQDVREDERTHIAREIHDSLGQALTALKLQLAAAHDAAARGTPSLSERLAETAQMVDDLVKGVRRIATELRPPILDQLGLPAAIDWLAHDFTRRTGIPCTATIVPACATISGELATALFRIVQEGLTNIVRHAAASRSELVLHVQPDLITLEVSDDGRGITEAAAHGPASLGILGMRERAAAQGGVLEVGPLMPHGTRISAWFPTMRSRR